MVMFEFYYFPNLQTKNYFKPNLVDYMTMVGKKGSNYFNREFVDFREGSYYSMERKQESLGRKFDSMEYKQESNFESIITNFTQF